MHRGDVYRLISEERTYQDNLDSSRTDGHLHSVGEELLLLEGYLRKATALWVDRPGDTLALDGIRKVAAIAVRCMENHGAPARGRYITHK